MSSKQIILAVLFITLIYFTVYHISSYTKCVSKSDIIKKQIYISNQKNIELYKELKDSSKNVKISEKNNKNNDEKESKLLNITKELAESASKLIPLQHRKIMLII
jgi:hypothetical protein